MGVFVLGFWVLIKYVIGFELVDVVVWELFFLVMVIYWIEGVKVVCRLIGRRDIDGCEWLEDVNWFVSEFGWFWLFNWMEWVGFVFIWYWYCICFLMGDMFCKGIFWEVIVEDWLIFRLFWGELFCSCICWSWVVGIICMNVLFWVLLCCVYCFFVFVSIVWIFFVV